MGLSTPARALGPAPATCPCRAAPRPAGPSCPPLPGGCPSSLPLPDGCLSVHPASAWRLSVRPRTPVLVPPPRAATVPLSCHTGRPPSALQERRQRPSPSARAGRRSEDGGRPEHPSSCFDAAASWACGPPERGHGPPFRRGSGAAAEEVEAALTCGPGGPAAPDAPASPFFPCGQRRGTVSGRRRPGRPNARPLDVLACVSPRGAHTRSPGVPYGGDSVGLGGEGQASGLRRLDSGSWPCYDMILVTCDPKCKRTRKVRLRRIVTSCPRPLRSFPRRQLIPPDAGEPFQRHFTCRQGRVRVHTCTRAHAHTHTRVLHTLSSLPLSIFPLRTVACHSVHQ